MTTAYPTRQAQVAILIFIVAITQSSRLPILAEPIKFIDVTTTVGFKSHTPAVGLVAGAAAADYDADGDVLYLHVGEPIEAEGEETPEGHVVRFEPGTQRVVGLTIINARWLLDRDGRLIVTVPETVEASADELGPALAAA